MNATDEVRKIWITRHPESVDKDSLTHIALFEYHEEKNPVCFIEHSAYLKLQQENAELIKALDDKGAQSLRYLRENTELRSALEFYADKSNYLVGSADVELDFGDTARKALARKDAE